MENQYGGFLNERCCDPEYVGGKKKKNKKGGKTVRNFQRRV